MASNPWIRISIKNNAGNSADNSWANNRSMARHCNRRIRQRLLKIYIKNPARTHKKTLERNKIDLDKKYISSQFEESNSMILVKSSRPVFSTSPVGQAKVPYRIVHFFLSICSEWIQNLVFLPPLICSLRYLGSPGYPLEKNTGNSWRILIESPDISWGRWEWHWKRLLLFCPDCSRTAAVVALYPPGPATGKFIFSIIFRLFTGIGVNNMDLSSLKLRLKILKWFSIIRI